MRIVDLAPEHERTYFVCLEDPSGEIKEASDHKEVWYRKMKDKGLLVKLALDDSGEAGGMIQCVPIERSPAEGKDLYFVHCIWVVGSGQKGGDPRRRGWGTALLQAAEGDVKARGARGVAAQGGISPTGLQASWFEKQGYTEVDREGTQVLLWKPFTSEAKAPRWIKQRKTPERIPGKVTVTALLNGWCPGKSMVFERARRAASEFGDRVVFQKIDSFDRKTVLEWGMADALFIDDEQVPTSPMPTYEKIKEMIAGRVRRP